MARSKEFRIRIKETQETETAQMGPFTAEEANVYRSFLDTLVQPVKLHRTNLSLLRQNTPPSYLKLAYPTVFPLSEISPVLSSIFIWFDSIALPVLIISPESFPV